MAGYLPIEDAESRAVGLVSRVVPDDRMLEVADEAARPVAPSARDLVVRTRVKMLARACFAAAAPSVDR